MVKFKVLCCHRLPQPYFGPCYQYTVQLLKIVSNLDRSIYCCKRLLKFYLIFICKYFRHKAVSSTDNKI